MPHSPEAALRLSDAAGMHTTAAALAQRADLVERSVSWQATVMDSRQLTGHQAEASILFNRAIGLHELTRVARSSSAMQRRRCAQVVSRRLRTRVEACHLVLPRETRRPVVDVLRVEPPTPVGELSTQLVQVGL